jgi:hypothetical protein
MDARTVFLCAAVRDGRLYAAPLGTPLDLDSPAWVDAGPAPGALGPLSVLVSRPGG